FRITASVRFLGRLHGYAIHRAGRGAEVTGDTAFLAVRVTGQDHAGPIAGTGDPLLFRVLDSQRAAAHMLPGCPEARNDGFYVGKYGHAEPFHKEICRDDGDAVTYLVHINFTGKLSLKKLRRHGYWENTRMCISSVLMKKYIYKYPERQTLP